MAATEASYDCFQSLSWPDTLPDNVLEHHDGRVEARARFSGRSLGTTRLGLHRDGQMEYLREILRARVYDVAVETPLQHAPLLSKRLGNDVFLKREDMQPVKSFKIRGAYNKMVNLSPSARDRGVICASAGNHAQGVALSANKLRLKAIIVMPKTTAPVKLEAVKSFGAEHVEIVLHGETFAEALSHAKQLEHDCGLTFVHPYDDPSVIVGQGTIGMEILRQFSKPLHAVFIAVGGGGMIAGIAAYIKQVRPEIRIIGVQTVDSNSMALSLQAGTPTAIEDVGMFADGTSIRMVGAETLRLAKLYVDEIVEVTTDQVCAALKDVFLDTRTVLEPSGAMSIAGAKLYCHNNPQLSGTNLVCVACGANINFDRLKFIVERAELGQERLLLLAVRLRQRPLMDLLRTTRNGIRDLSYDGDRLLLGLSVDDFDQADKVKESLASFKFVDLTTNEYGKVHQRYMTGRIQAETVVRFEFQERIGAVLRLLERIADGSFRISAVHYSCSGGDVARVLIGVANSRSSFVAFCEKLGKPYRRFFDETNNPAYQLFCE